MSAKKSNVPVILRKFIFSFILVTALLSFWVFANDVTNPLVAVFKDVFVITNAQSTWVQMAFYGALLSIPAAVVANFNLFIVELYVLTFGLAFLENTANPYILSMGPPETATQRLNLAQAFTYRFADGYVYRLNSHPADYLGERL